MKTIGFIPFYLFVFAVLLASSAFANTRLVSLYERDALVTERLLPFKLSGSGEIQVVSSSASAGCYAATDLFYKDIVLLYCDTIPKSHQEQYVDTDLEVIYTVDGEMKRSKVGQLRVRHVTIIEKNKAPALPPQSEPVGGTAFEKGQSLYNTNCMSCHGSIPIGKPQSTTSINAAFTRGDMQVFQGRFTAQEIADLITYLNGRP